jgi:hypothetical protein
MLVAVSRTITERQTIELPVPFYSKHKQFEWFYMVTENEVVQILPGTSGSKNAVNFLPAIITA